jgi:hypothetical protein
MQAGGRCGKSLGPKIVSMPTPPLRRSLAILGVAAFLLIGVGCGGSSGSSTTEATNPPARPQPSEPKNATKTSPKAPDNAIQTRPGGPSSSSGY